MIINTDEYEVAYELLEQLAVSIEEDAGLMVDDMEELPDDQAARIRDLARKQAELLRSVVAEVARLDAAMIRELGWGEDEWAMFHPRLVREHVDLAAAMQAGMDLQPEWEALWGGYIEARESGNRDAVRAAAHALRAFDMRNGLGESGPHWKGHRSS